MNQNGIPQTAPLQSILLSSLHGDGFEIQYNDLALMFRLGVVYHGFS